MQQNWIKVDKSLTNGQPCFMTPSGWFLRLSVNKGSIVSLCVLYLEEEQLELLLACGSSLHCGVQLVHRTAQSILLAEVI